jgi:hypothetical protein
MTAPIADCTTESLLGAITGGLQLGPKKEKA